MPRVLIVQSRVKRYRLPFFVGLYSALKQDGIDLTVAYSAPNGEHLVRADQADLPKEFGRKVKGHWFADRLLYQPLWREIMRADLLIVGPENKFLINPSLLLLSGLGLKRVAFWGLGPNMHPDRSEFSEWIKERVLTTVDWWFAYTESVADYLRKRGMPAERITTVHNATDTRELRRLMDEIDEKEIADAKIALTGNRDSRIGLYCGLIGKIKSLPLLLDSARRVRKSVRNFHLIIVGNGPDRAWLELAIANDPWIHYMGSQYGRQSALFYKMAEIFLLTGTAGLALVDSFAAGLPVIATSLPTHPPEISYLRNGENGRLTAHDPQVYAATVVELLTDHGMMAKLRRGATETGSAYTIEMMIENFRTGIKQCLAFGSPDTLRSVIRQKTTTDTVNQRAPEPKTGSTFDEHSIHL
jgi:L-malate glycosyltransferase